MSTAAIPVLDMSRFRAGGAEEAAFVGELGDALPETGFFSVTHHGVDRALIASAYRATADFFAQPEAVKRRYEDPALKGQRGFTRFGREHAKDHPEPDLKEFWHVGRELPAGHPRAAEFPTNLWPEGNEEFRSSVGELYRQLDRCALRLLEAVALYLGEERGRIAEMAREGNTLLRLVHYPPVPEGTPTAGLRAAPHEDINLITLLCESTGSGLEILTRAGDWLPVEAPPGQIIVDAGDMLQNLTNGLLRSTTHRVANPGNPREARLSMPFFVHPRSEVSLAPLPSCIQRTGGVPRYPALTAGEYLLQRLQAIGLA